MKRKLSYTVEVTTTHVVTVTAGDSYEARKKAVEKVLLFGDTPIEIDECVIGIQPVKSAEIEYTEEQLETDPVAAEGARFADLPRREK